MSDYPWYVDLLIDLITLGIVFAWIGWTHATVQQRGASPILLVTSMTTILILVLIVYRQRLTYLKLGDKVVAGFEDTSGREREDPEQGRNR